MSLEITSEFIAENEKRGGPYSKEDRIKRQAEVYRLHFERSYSPPKVAEIMKINVKTIYDDIKILNKRLGLEWSRLGSESFLMKQVNRLELQRQRLVDRMESAKELSDIMTIERMLYELDCKLVSIVFKSTWNDDKLIEDSIRQMNMWSKNNGLDHAWVSTKYAYKCSPETVKKINRLIEEDEKTRGLVSVL